jgi:hypothetical protein
MKPKSLYLGLCVVGTVLPYSRFVPYLREHALEAGVRHLWMPIAANLAVGVSLGLPLFLYVRERRLEASGTGQPG